MMDGAFTGDTAATAEKKLDRFVLDRFADKIYTLEDIWWRCRDNGHLLAKDTVKASVVRLVKAGRVRLVQKNKGGACRAVAIYERAA